MPSPRIHPRTIEAVKERADIVDVVGEHVVLKKKGRENERLAMEIKHLKNAVKKIHSNSKQFEKK